MIISNSKMTAANTKRAIAHPGILSLLPLPPQLDVRGALVLPVESPGELVTLLSGFTVVLAFTVVFP